MRRKIVLAGGTGFLGQSLARHLQKQEHEVVILTRSAASDHAGLRYVHWDGRTLGPWLEEIEGADAVVNFTGKSVNCIYTLANKQEIISSRLDSVRVIDEALAAVNKPPTVVVQAGSLAIFGNTTELRDEQGEHGSGFSVRVCQLWEQEFFRREIEGVRKVMLRIGFALGPDGGALEPLVKLARRGLGGTIGSGKQMISWLHLDDLNAMFDYVLNHEHAAGIYNATGQQAVSNREFMQTLRHVLNKGWSPDTPSLFVRIGAYLIMRADPELALSGRNCVPKRFMDEGFQFQYRNLEQALRQILNT